MNRLAIGFYLLMIFLLSCTPKLRFREGLEFDKFDYEYLTGKAKVKFDGGDMNISGTLNMRMKQDSAIWMSVSPALNIEVARILITTDSIRIINKIGKKYMVYSFQELSEVYDFNFSFDLIQSLLVGNLVFPYTKENLTKVENGLSFRQHQQNLIIDHYIGTGSKKLEKLIVLDKASQTSAEVSYGDFKSVDAEIFPHFITAILKDGQTGQTQYKVEISYSKAQMADQQLKFPFNVPDKFQDF